MGGWVGGWVGELLTSSSFWVDWGRGTAAATPVLRAAERGREEEEEEEEEEVVVGVCTEYRREWMALRMGVGREVGGWEERTSSSSSSSSFFPAGVCTEYRREWMALRMGVGREVGGWEERTSSSSSSSSSVMRRGVGGTMVCCGEGGLVGE